MSAVVSLLIAVLVLLASLLGEAPERAVRMRGLRILGARRRELARAHLRATVLPIGTLGLSASLVGWVVCRSMYTFDDRATVPSGVVLWCAVGSVAAGLAIGLLALPDAIRPTRRSAAVDA